MWISMFFLALREIRRNLVRSGLTILGIVIGVGAVIAVVTIGQGASAQITQDIAGLGENMLIVAPARAPGARFSTAPAFRDRDVQAIRKEIPGVVAVAPMAQQSVLAVYGNENFSTNVTGTTNDFMEVRDWPVDRGRHFTESELNSGRMVCILGETVRKELFGSQECRGKSIRLGKLSCRVIGVLESKGQASFGQDQDDLILIPIRALQRRLAGNQNVSTILVEAESSSVLPRVKSDLERLMRERRRILKDTDDDFEINSIEEISNLVQQTTGILTTVIGAIAGVSLLVGGIGIMNIMLVSVTERTREIGIRLAIGAQARDVLLQFLIEAATLSSLGGLVGIGLGLLSGWLATDLIGLPFVIDPLIIAIAFLFSGAVGLVFGFFPARRAAKLDPIEALRHE